MPRLLLTIIVSLLTIFPSASSISQWGEREPFMLPKWETAEESLLRGTYVPPSVPEALVPPNPVRALAEYEELEGVVVRWAWGTQNALLGQIVAASRLEGTVWILVRPGTTDSTNIKNYLTGQGVPLSNLEFVSVPTNSIWCRDYGPWTVYDVTNDSMAIVDFVYNRPRPQDDVVPGFLASRWGLPLYATTDPPNRLVHTGGNFMVDGFTTGFASRLIIDENPSLTSAQIDTIMRRFTGLDRFVTMTRTYWDVISHIDMHMKLLDEETLLIGQYPVNRADYAVIEANVAMLRTINGPYGRPYRIIRIPMPPDAQGRYPDNGSAYLTYTNSTIVNGTVMVPTYALPTDEPALQVYRDAMPGYTVVGMNSNAIIGLGGAVHCITKEVGVREPVHIAHARFDDTVYVAGASPLPVRARISVRSGVDSAFVFWRANPQAPFTAVLMEEKQGEYVGEIPAQPSATTISYFLAVKTGSGRMVSKPLVGSVGAYRFLVLDSTVTSVMTPEVPLQVGLSQNFPNPFNPFTIILYSISRPTHVSLKVFTVLGQEVETLFEGFQDAGRYHAEISAHNYASGTYYYRLTAGEFVETRRMVVLK